MRSGCKEKFVCPVRHIYLRDNSHGVQSPIPESLEVNPCNINHWEHGNWDLPLHTKVPSPKFQVCHECLHGNIFISWDLGRVIRVGSSKQPDPTLNTSPVVFLPKIIKDPTLMIINHILTVSWDSKVGTSSPYWDRLTRVRLGTWDLGPVWGGP